MAKRVLTYEIAKRILGSMIVVQDAGVEYEGVEVSNVSYADGAGEPFMWEESEEPYAIVNFKATNSYQLQQAIDKLRDLDEDATEEELQDALNCNLSLRMDVEKAKRLDVNTIGGLTCRHAMVQDPNSDDPNDQVEALLPRSFVKAPAVKGKTADINALLDKRTNGDVAKAKINENGDPAEKQIAKKDKQSAKAAVRK